LRAPPALKGRAIAVTPAILAIGTDIALEFDPLGVAAVQCAAFANLLFADSQAESYSRGFSVIGKNEPKTTSQSARVPIP
jgi:hypothetical protein